MSGLWLCVSIVQPRWGRNISSNSRLGPSTATLLTAGLAKTIELSFVTIVITVMGQILTRRAIARKSRGTTLAEMSMRSWVIQPGSLITHFGMLRHSEFTVIGTLSLLAALVAALYTTASDAMVSPKLKFGSWEPKVLSGYVRASYGNSEFVKLTCPTMLTNEDAIEAPLSCADVIVSGESYRNLHTFMGIWAAIKTNGSSTVRDLAKRPAGIASLNGNTTLYGSWIETEHSNVPAHFNETGRIINNVTLAMPHPGVALAATSPLNGILQPSDLSGVGEYAVKAGVVSPAINVMCVNMSPDELKPLIYTEWPYANNTVINFATGKIGREGWELELPPVYNSRGEMDYMNATVVDDIFRWGPRYARRPPVFQMYPGDFSTVVNHSVWLSDAIYVLGKKSKFENYTMCELRSWVSPRCSTEFNISGISGSKMVAHCEDDHDSNGYWRSFPSDQEWPPPVASWTALARQWSLASDLNGGLRDSKAANSRILTQLALSEPRLATHLPSIAEAMAVFASSSLILGSVRTPFRHEWNYSAPNGILGEPGQVHSFNASVVTQQYTSGHVYKWQRFFYVILCLMLGLNILCCAYILGYASLVTDYTEAHNLFALALNSPSNQELRGACGGGPEGPDLAIPWRVGYASSANHYFIEQAGAVRWGKGDGKPVDDDRTAGTNYSRLRNDRQWV
ncbi:hypothetical protein V2A60_001235 [Cordyceps javanica]